MRPAFDDSGVESSLAAVRARIAGAGGDLATVRIVAVTKGFGPGAAVAARRAGLADVGENYAQELLSKRRALEAEPGGAELASSLRWHFLGAVQRNKVRSIAALVTCWQGVARQSEGEAIARHRPGAQVLVEVDASAVPGRNGCPPGDVPALVGALRSLDLDVRGLMTVAPLGRPAGESFRLVRRLADDLGLPERSMGMSDDLETAIAAGATMVRVGRALFGDRPPARVTSG